MDDYRYIAIEGALRALQAGNETLHADAVLVRQEVAAVQSAVNRLEGDVNKLQSDLTKVQSDVVSQQTFVLQVQAEVTILNGKFDFFIEHYAKKVDVEMVRTEFYKAMEAQTWRLITWMTVVCSGLTAAVYFIARNVH
jgi:predicted nuclease with TOPRIM domain